MIAECKNCGGPLAVVAQVRLIECAYCHKTNRVRSMRTLAMQQPPDWRPPSQWTPPADAKAESTPLEYRATEEKTSRPKSPLAVGLILMVLMIIPSAAIVGYKFWNQADDHAQARVSNVAPADFKVEEAPAPIWSGSEPFQCGDRDVHVLDGVDVTLAHRTAIEISGHCQVTLRNSHIAAWEGISVQDHGRLLIEGSTIEASEAVIAATGHAQIEVVDSTLTSAGVAVTASSHSHIVLAGGDVTGSPRAIGRRARRHVEVRDAEVHDVSHHRAGTRRHHMARHTMADPSPAAAPAGTPCGQRCAASLSNCLSSANDEIDRHGCSKFDESCRHACSP